MNARGTPKEEKPFVWLSSKALTAISDHAKHPATARSVYLALCEIANIEETPKFRRTIKRIAGQADLRYSATQRALRNLAAIGLIEIIDIEKTSPTRNAGCIFTILSLKKSGESDQLVRYQIPDRPVSDTGPSGTKQLTSALPDTDRETIKKKKNKNPVGGKTKAGKKGNGEKAFDEMNGGEHADYFRRLQTEAHAREWEASANE